MSYWAIIGRCCLDGGFRSDLLNKVQPGENDTSKLTGLWDFLCDTHDYRISRWELGDLNRLFSTVKPPPSGLGKPMADTAETWRTALQKFPVSVVSLETYSLVGLCAIDQQIAKRYCDAASLSGVNGIVTENAKPPRFTPEGLEPAVLADFFADTNTFAHLKAIETKVWIPPGYACAGGTVVHRLAQGNKAFTYLNSAALSHVRAEVEDLFREKGF